MQTNKLDPDNTTPVSLVSSARSGGVAVTANVSMSGCLSGSSSSYNTGAVFELGTFALIISDTNCVFTFPTNAVAFVYNATNYYGISGSNTITSASSSQAVQLKFSTSIGDSTDALNVFVQTSNVFPVQSSPTFNFTIEIPTTITSINSGTGTFSVTNDGTPSSFVQLTSLSITPSIPSKLQVGNTQTFTVTGTYADGSTATLTSSSSPSVTWSSSNTAVATIASTGVATGVAAGTTNIIAQVSDGLGGANYTFSETLTVRAHNVYAATSDAKVMMCDIASDGTISACRATGLFVGTAGVLVSGGLFYLSDQSAGTIRSCSINGDGTLPRSSSCNTSTTISNALGLAISGSYAYVANGTNVYGCNLSAGTFSNCATIASGTFSSPSSVVQNNGFLYVGNNGNSTLSVCTITAGTPPTLSNCAATSTFASPLAMTVYNASYLYVVNEASNYVSYCAINPSTGALSGCANSSGTFTNPNGLAVYGSTLYVSEYAGNKRIWACPINSDGSLGTCVATVSLNATLKALTVN